MKSSFLVITSIADADHPVLKTYAKKAIVKGITLIVIGDRKSPEEFTLPGCDFYSVERQRALSFSLAQVLPYNHYARKNIGYLVAISKGAEIIIETDDDNLPSASFWDKRNRMQNTPVLTGQGWVNVYRYFTQTHVWPRGFALEHLHDEIPPLSDRQIVDCPIQQGLAAVNPDVDAIYRLTLPLPVNFHDGPGVAFGRDCICPFNSQNTTWFNEAFPLLYLPSCCSFRMTDIWRSFVAQRIAWECDWHTLFHQSTVWQERNDHDLLRDFRDEIPGYLHNGRIVTALKALQLQPGKKHIPSNMRLCYKTIIDMGLIGVEEMPLLEAWLMDLQAMEV
jgi:hypothetical protein